VFVPDARQDLPDRIKSLAGSWTAYAAIGSFVLYFFGHLTLRFRLTMLGVNADLAALDERYFFAGASFLVYLVVAAANAVLAMLVFAESVTVTLRNSSGPSVSMTSNQ
jgi:hypothetical protein